MIIIIVKQKQKQKEQLNDFESHPHQRFYTKTVKDKGLVVGRPITANPGITSFFFLLFRGIFSDNFLYSNHQIVDRTKKTEFAFYAFISEFKFCTSPGLS